MPRPGCARLGVLMALTLARSWPAAAAAAKGPDAAAILERAEAVRSPGLDYVVDLELQVLNPDTSWKERTAAYSVIAHGKDQTIVLMRQPSNLYPGLLLIDEGRYWLLLPKPQSPFQLAPQHVLQGDISYGDLARDNLLASYEARLDGEEPIDGQDCWRLELTRTRGFGLYPRIRTWITKQHSRPSKFEYFGETGARVKVARYEDYREGPIGPRAMRIVVDNLLGGDERTVMTFTNLRRLDTSVLRFDPEELVLLRDAALVGWSTTGVQVRPEDLLAVRGAATAHP